MHLDFLGALLTLAVALLTVGTRFTISPGQTGIVLSYILTVQQVLFCHSLLFTLAVDDILIQSFGWMVRQVAEVENNMNAVERVVHYAKELEQEPAWHRRQPCAVELAVGRQGRHEGCNYEISPGVTTCPQGPEHVYLPWREYWCRRAVSISCCFQ
jgi:hypothetical protein